MKASNVNYDAMFDSSEDFYNSDLDNTNKNRNNLNLSDSSNLDTSDPYDVGTIMYAIAQTIKQRSDYDPELSYTAYLVSQGLQFTCESLADAVEELYTNVMQYKLDYDATTKAAADILYRTFAILETNGVPVARVMEELKERMSISDVVTEDAMDYNPNIPMKVPSEFFDSVRDYHNNALIENKSELHQSTNTLNEVEDVDLEDDYEDDYYGSDNSNYQYVNKPTHHVKMTKEQKQKEKLALAIKKEKEKAKAKIAKEKARAKMIIAKERMKAKAKIESAKKKAKSFKSVSANSTPRIYSGINPVNKNIFMRTESANDVVDFSSNN